MYQSNHNQSLSTYSSSGGMFVCRTTRIMPLSSWCSFKIPQTQIPQGHLIPVTFQTCHSIFLQYSARGQPATENVLEPTSLRVDHPFIALIKHNLPPLLTRSVLRPKQVLSVIDDGEYPTDSWRYNHNEITMGSWSTLQYQLQLESQNQVQREWYSSTREQFLECCRLGERLTIWLLEFISLKELLSSRAKRKEQSLLHSSDCGCVTRVSSTLQSRSDSCSDRQKSVVGFSKPESFTQN